MTQLRHLRRLVRSRLGVPVTDQLFTDDQLDDAINLANQTLDAEQRWPWQERVAEVTVNQDDGYFYLPDDWRATRQLVYSSDDRRPLALVSPSDILGTDVSSNGVPEVWSPLNNLIYIRPRASGTFKFLHYYYAQPLWLRDDDDRPALPDQFTGALVAKAAELLATREDDRSAAAAHNAEYSEWVDRMRRDVRRSTTPVVPRVRAGSWIE